MDVIDLWELLSNVDDWSFETFPWDVFSLCHSTTVERVNSELLSKNRDDVLQQEEEFSTLSDASNEIISLNHVPPAEVPNHQADTNCDVSCEKCRSKFSISHGGLSDIENHLETKKHTLADAFSRNMVVQTLHSNQSFISENTDDYQNALQSSETEKSKTDESSYNPSLLIVASTDIKSAVQTLEESMLSLQLSLEDRSTLSAFEKLHKTIQDEPREVAKSLENVPKNRYKDVLPYDKSRVVLSEGPDGDYINASFVHMSLPQPRKPTEYIATQGPLPQTSDDFWQMVWEQKCGIIVMVTTLKERNRVKCHQYWPDLYQTETYNQIQVTCFSETTSTTGVMRDFLISNQQVNEERHVIQLQYINWPDHGVPEDSSDFLEFVQQLRGLRRDVGGFVVVHCSAGVGRTGVLILMETAMGYIDADEPIYPLEMVKEMRNQRLMMVQTVVQYKFICEAILKAYNDRCKMIEKN